MVGHSTAWPSPSLLLLRAIRWAPAFVSAGGLTYTFARRPAMSEAKAKPAEATDQTADAKPARKSKKSKPAPAPAPSAASDSSPAPASATDPAPATATAATAEAPAPKVWEPTLTPEEREAKAFFYRKEAMRYAGMNCPVSINPHPSFSAGFSDLKWLLVSSAGRPK